MLPLGTPYFANDRATIYCDDCANIARKLGRRSVDLVVTDPPYGSAFTSGFGDHPPLQNDDPEDRQQIARLIREALRPLSDGAHAYVFGFRDADLTDAFASTTELIWDKGSVGMGDLAATYGPSHEPILFGVYYPDKANKAKKRGALTARLRRGSVLRVARKNSLQTRRHPTEKPVALLRQLIESSSVVGDLVFDPFAGVGSTAVAAILTGRRSISVEIDEGYCAIARERVIAASALADQFDRL